MAKYPFGNEFKPSMPEPEPVPRWLVNALRSLYEPRSWTVPLACLVSDSLVDANAAARSHSLEFAAGTLRVDVEVCSSLGNGLRRLTVRAWPEQPDLCVVSWWSRSSLQLGQGSPPVFDRVPCGIVQIWLAGGGVWVRTDWFRV